MKISINYVKPIDKLLHKLKTYLKKDDEFIGNNNFGKFYVKTVIGNFKGSYIIKDDIIHIDIEKKPIFLSSKLIEQEIKKYLKNN